MVVDRGAPSEGSLFGFYRRGSREVVPIEFCLAHDRALERAMGDLRGALFGAGALLSICRFVEARRYDDGALLATLHLVGEPNASALEEARAVAERFYAWRARARALARRAAGARSGDRRGARGVGWGARAPER